MRQTFSKLIVAFALVSSTVAVSAQTNSITLTLDQETRPFLRSAEEDKWFKKENFASTVLGGVLAIAGGLAATLWADNLQARRKRREDAEFSENVIRAIRREIEAIQEIYNKGIGGRLRECPKGQRFPFWLGMTQNWFTVFDSNAVNLGKIEGELSRQIITVYIRMKQLIEEFRINGEYLKWLKEATAELQRRPMEASIIGQYKDIEGLMLSQVTRMQECDQALKAAADELFNLLNQRGIN